MTYKNYTYYASRDNQDFRWQAHWSSLPSDSSYSKKFHSSLTFYSTPEKAYDRAKKEIDKLILTSSR